MRKSASILMAMITLLAGIHLSIASHLCQGRVVDVNISLTGINKVSCGMEVNEVSSPSGQVIMTHCCVNELTTLKVDPNFSPSHFKNTDVYQKVIHASGELPKDIAEALDYTSCSRSKHSPPGIYQPNAVELADICVFRI